MCKDSILCNLLQNILTKRSHVLDSEGLYKRSRLASREKSESMKISGEKLFFLSQISYKIMR